MLDQINKELRDASQKQAAESWGGPTQSRKENE
jgi:hypothetical protein